MNRFSDHPSYRHNLIVMRHAKSDWTNGLADVSRPLSERGLRDSVAAGHWFETSDIEPDLVLVSPSARTQQTWELIAEQLSWSPTAVIDRRIYAADPNTLVQIVRELPEEVGTVVMVGHNPGCEVLVSDLAGPDSNAAAFDRLASKYRTLGTARLGVPNGWADVAVDGCDLLDFVAPRG
jgi:phosphohistidine phosphatase